MQGLVTPLLSTSRNFTRHAILKQIPDIAGLAQLFPPADPSTGGQYFRLQRICLSLSPTVTRLFTVNHPPNLAHIRKRVNIQNSGIMAIVLVYFCDCMFFM